MITKGHFLINIATRKIVYIYVNCHLYKHKHGDRYNRSFSGADRKKSKINQSIWNEKSIYRCCLKPRYFILFTDNYVFFYFTLMISDLKTCSVFFHAQINWKQNINNNQPSLSNPWMYRWWAHSSKISTTSWWITKDDVAPKQIAEISPLHTNRWETSANVNFFSHVS